MNESEWGSIAFPISDFEVEGVKGRVINLKRPESLLSVTFTGEGRIIHTKNGRIITLKALNGKDGEHWLSPGLAGITEEDIAFEN